MTISADGVTLEVPEGWEQVDQPGLTLAVAGPAGTAVAEGAQFRPSLTAIVVEAAADADIRILGTEAIAAATLVSDDAHVLAYDVWPMPDGTAGRRLELAFQSGEVPLCVRAVDRPARRPRDHPDRDVRRGPPAPGRPPARGPGHAGPGHPGDPMTLPRLDPYLVSIGAELEDVSRISAAQPFTHQGPALPREDLEVLARAAKARLRKVGATPTLTAAGLMDESGLTEDGRTIAGLLTQPEARMHVESGRGRAPLTLDVYLRGGLALTVATTSPASLDQTPHGDTILEVAGTVGLDVVDSSGVPALIASWVGLAPGWSLATTPDSILEETVLARVDEPATPPPPGADAHLRHVWSQPWFLWTLRASGSETGLVVVRAGSAGQYLLTTATEPGHVGFSAVPSAQLWAHLVEQTALAARA